MAKDPICGMNVNEKEAKKKGLVVKKDSKTHHFCSADCKDKFENKGKAVKWYRSEGFEKSFPFVLGFILVAGTVLSIAFDFMILYNPTFLKNNVGK